MNIKKSFIFLFITIIFIYVFLFFALQNKNIYNKYNTFEKKYSFLPSLALIDRGFNEINIFKAAIRRGNVDDSDSVNLFLSYQDLIYFRDYYYQSLNNSTFLQDEGNEWRKAKVSMPDNDKLKAKIKLHGTSQTPLKNSMGFVNSVIYKVKGSLLDDKEYPKKYLDITNGGYAFKIKLSDEKVFDGKSRINLLSPHDDWTTTGNALNKYIFSQNIITTYGNFYNLFVNGSDIGLYLGIENISKSLLERNFQITNYGILKNYDDWDKAWSIPHASPTMYTAHDMEQSGELLTQQIALFQLKRLFEAIDENDFETIKILIDIHYFAKVFASILLVGDFHPLYGDNTRYIYDFSTGTFKISYRIEGSPKKIHYTYDEDNITLSMRGYGPHILFHKLSTQSWFNDLIIKNLVKIKNDSSHIINIIDEEHSVYKSVANKSRFPSNHLTYKYFDERDIIIQNLELIKLITNNNLSINLDNSLEKRNQDIDIDLGYAKTFFNIEKDNSDEIFVNVLNDSLKEITLLSLTNCDGDKFNLESPLQVEPSVYDLESGMIINNDNYIFKIPSNYHCINKAEVVKNDSNNMITDKNIYFNYSKSFNLVESDGLNQFGSNIRKITDTKDNSVTYLISKGTYEVNKDIIFPHGARLILEPGANILLSESKSIFVRGDFYAKGTSSEPITIRNKDNKPYGTFAVKGTTLKPSEVIIENLLLEGGSEAVIDGTYFSGQLSIHIANVVMKDSKFFNSFSDDGINIKLGNVEIRNNIFKDNSADQVDLDFVNGEVSDNTFIYSKNNTNVSTDGLDVSGSILEVYKNSFINMTDKGLSIGEKSFVSVYNNEVKNNNIGIALKDGSKLCLNQNLFSNNVDDISQYIKKNMYKMPSMNVDEQYFTSEENIKGQCNIKEFIDNKISSLL